MSVTRALTIVPAGAGAGKTYRIKTQLADWVRRGVVRPDRILAVTFTEAAASELRERIRAGLLADGLVEEALAVETAYVSTIHGLGLRLLTEHAFAAGTSPAPRHIGDAERDLLIRQALVHATALDPVKAEPERFGYQPNWHNGETIEEGLRNRVLSMVDLLRTLGDKGRDAGLIEPALARLDAVYGPSLADPETARTTLQAAVVSMLEAFPNGGMGEITAKTPRANLEADLALFQKIARDPAILARDWSAWQALRCLFVSNSRSKTPEGYDEMAEAIMAAASALPGHPGPLEDAKLHLRCLIACAQEVMEAYEARKTSLGLIDFADMITNAERLLRQDPSVLGAILGEIDCVIIDEFQDTNPVQFALLWQLGAQAPRTLLVGDVKQSIMGFQGADPRLSVALAASNPDATKPLDRNWRSTPAVMAFVNAVGQGLFGAGYNPLAPTRDSVEGPALDIVRVAKSRSVQKFSKPQEHVAEYIARILNGKDRVTDRHTGKTRCARPSDIALLVCRHATATRYADELRDRGVPVRIAEDGWYGSPAVQAACAALACTANPADVLAGLLLRTLGPEPRDLQGALTAELDGELAGDPVLERLAGLSDRLAYLPISVALDMVLDAAGIRIWAERQPDAGQARADLLRLEAEALEFEAAHRDLKAASGFHGETAKVFLGWLAARGGERDFDRRPDPSARSAEAVEIVTWHGSKGREWPITVVAEFDNGILERPGTTSARFARLDRIDDMRDVLASAELVHTPCLVAPEAQARFIEDRRPDFEVNAKNLLYVALTRARDRLVLEWPDFLKERPGDAPDATCLFHVFEDTCAPAFARKKLKIGGVECPARIVELPDIAGFSTCAQGDAARRIRFGKAGPLPETPLTPWRLVPSEQTGAGPVPQTQSFTLGPAWPAMASDTTRGTALHMALQTFLTRPELADALPAATGLDGETLSRIRDRADALRSWLEARSCTELQCEIPVLGHSEDGAEIPGSIDLLAKSPEGYLLIDHKSGGDGDGLGPYWPQLSTYLHIAGQTLPDHRIRGVGVFWIDHGRLELALGEIGSSAGQTTGG